jgi:hypothetical protein
MNDISMSQLPLAGLPKDQSTRLESFKPLASGDVDELFQKMSEADPSLARLVAAGDKSAQRDTIAALDWHSRQRSLMSIMALGFHLQKVARHDEALALQDIALEIIGQEPEERTQSFFDRTRPRLMGDELATIGRIHAEKGDLTAALAAYHQADRCFEEDAALRAQLASPRRPKQTASSTSRISARSYSPRWPMFIAGSAKSPQLRSSFEGPGSIPN